MKRRMSSQTSHCHELCDLAGSSKPALRPHHQRPKPRPRRSGPRVSESVEKREVAHQASCLPHHSQRSKPQALEPVESWRQQVAHQASCLPKPASGLEVAHQASCLPKPASDLPMLGMGIEMQMQYGHASVRISEATAATWLELHQSTHHWHQPRVESHAGCCRLHLDPTGGDGGLGRVHQQGAICNLWDNNFRFWRGTRLLPCVSLRLQLQDHLFAWHQNGSSTHIHGSGGVTYRAKVQDTWSHVHFRRQDRKLPKTGTENSCTEMLVKAPRYNLTKD